MHDILGVYLLSQRQYDVIGVQLALAISSMISWQLYLTKRRPFERKSCKNNVTTSIFLLHLIQFRLSSFGLCFFFFFQVVYDLSNNDFSGTEVRILYELHFFLSGFHRYILPACNFLKNTLFNRTEHKVWKPLSAYALRKKEQRYYIHCYNIK